jgi:hypothetical protein
LKIKCLILDNGGEFTSKEFMELYSEHGIKRKFLVARTPEKNGVVQRKNIIVQKMARTMLMDSKLAYVIWVQEVHTIVFIQNIGMLKNNSDKTPYELWKGRPKNVNHFRVFGRKCYIKREDGRIGKVDSQVDKGILVRYSSKRKAYKFFNMRLNRIVESINVMVDETDGRNTKESRKDSVERDQEEDLKEE